MKITTEQIKNLIIKYFCCCYFYYKNKKIQPEIIKENEEKEEKELQKENHLNSSSSHLFQDQKIIKKFIKKWEQNFWIEIWKNNFKKEIQKESVIQIQRIVRGFLGRLKYKKKYKEGINEMNKFWMEKREQKLLEKEKERIKREVRRKVEIHFLTEISQNFLILILIL